MVKNKGLGDSIEQALQKIGVDKIAKKVLGEDCGCEERKKTLNSIFPYTKVRQFTPDEKKIYEDIMGRTKSVLKGNDHANIIKLYNKVFNANKKPSGCGSCIKKTLQQLEKVYKNSCDNEKAH
tara:strand:+ start:1192 stop:1560 length:369 start_codon:yes stop_codon:yes gene_type:complete